MGSTSPRDVEPIKYIHPSFTVFLTMEESNLASSTYYAEGSKDSNFSESSTSTEAISVDHMYFVFICREWLNRFVELSTDGKATDKSCNFLSIRCMHVSIPRCCIGVPSTVIHLLRTLLSMKSFINQYRLQKHNISVACKSDSAIDSVCLS